MACWSWTEVRILSSETFLCTSDRASVSERRAGLHTFQKKRRSRHGHGSSAVTTLLTGRKWRAEDTLPPWKDRRRWPRTSGLPSGTACEKRLHQRRLVSRSASRKARRRTTRYQSAGPPLSRAPAPDSCTLRFPVFAQIPAVTENQRQGRICLGYASPARPVVNHRG
jgi:hypothetical protein